MASRAEQIARIRAETTETRLAGQALPTGGAWVTAARREALGRLQAMGLPTRRDEYWKYTNPETLTAPEPTSAALFDTAGKPPLFHEIDRVRLVFVDGVFDPEVSDDPGLAGVEIDRLAEAGRADIHWAKELYGTLEARGQTPVPRTLAALNTAFAEDGFLIRATGRGEKPVSLVYLHRSETSDAMLHHCVKVEPGAELTLLESGAAAARLNTVLEVDVADGGRFHHVRMQGRDHERRAATHIFARIGEGAVFKSFTGTLNGRLTRNECVLELAGRDGVAHVAGAAVGDGDFHQDDTVFVTHAAPGCESRQVFKKVLRRGAVGVFQGKILVEQPAQLTDGYQISQSLLLDEDSQFLVKPELEIYADDVKCSHGSTSGAIDPAQLFYLRARGMPREEAQALLVLAFLGEALDEIEDDRLAEDIRERLAAWLNRHRDG